MFFTLMFYLNLIIEKYKIIYIIYKNKCITFIKIQAYIYNLFNNSNETNNCNL